ncbi:DUF1826 domain-containing protein [Cytophagaceae bacterium ABcell3]|nr:DUF1826 domain-containing protein [Cytophagaceae bacterium ABcell3]
MAIIKQKTPLAPHYIYAQNLSELNRIQEPEYNIAIHRRQPISPIVHFTDQLLHTSLKSISLKGSAEELAWKFEKELKAQGLHSKQGYLEFLDDIFKIINAFGRIIKADTIKLYFAVVNSNMCRLFHTDINDLRLLCTYRGPGTIWVRNDNINKKCLNKESNDSLLINPDQTENTEAFDITILKGALHTSNYTMPVFHRSPSIEETKEQRVLLRLDTGAFLSELS